MEERGKGTEAASNHGPEYCRDSRLNGFRGASEGLKRPALGRESEGGR